MTNCDCTHIFTVSLRWRSFLLVSWSGPAVGSYISLTFGRIFNVLVWPLMSQGTLELIWSTHLLRQYRFIFLFVLNLRPIRFFNKWHQCFLLLQSILHVPVLQTLWIKAWNLHRSLNVLSGRNRHLPWHFLLNSKRLWLMSQAKLGCVHIHFAVHWRVRALLIWIRSIESIEVHLKLIILLGAAPLLLSTITLASAGRCILIWFAWFGRSLLGFGHEIVNVD